MSWEEITAYGVVAAGVLFILFQHLVSAAVGLALYLILDRVSARSTRTSPAARPIRRRGRSSRPSSSAKPHSEWAAW
jgi:hypothetical protein